MSEPVTPIVNALNAPFWAAAQRGELVLPHCVDTGRAFWPPSPISPFAGGDVDWRAADPRGVVRALAVYRRPFQKAFEPLMPYGVALVELRGGPRLMAHVSDPDGDAPRVGDAVVIAFQAVLADAPPIPVALKSGDSP